MTRMVVLSLIRILIPILVLAGCVTAHGPVAVPATSCPVLRPPDALHRILKLKALWRDIDTGETGAARGHGFSLDGFHVWTAGHLYEAGSEGFRWMYGISKGTLERDWAPEKKLDLGLLRPSREEIGDGQRPPILEAANREPVTYERVWYVGYADVGKAITDETQDVVFAGYYLGRDRDGQYVIDGASCEGVSGGALLTDDGKVLGLVNALGHMQTAREAFRHTAGDTPAVIQYLFHLANHRPMTYATPLYKTDLYKR